MIKKIKQQLKKLNIKSDTEIYCIFGNPVKHSLSPVMQNAAFSHTGTNAIYLAFKINNLSEAISAMKTLNIQGASITIPFKVDVIEFLDNIAPEADKIGSVNTLHNVNGNITGYNTDGFGALDALINTNVIVENSNILIIGNGGSARAIAFTMLAHKANITIAGRSKERIIALTNDLQKHYNNTASIPIKEITVDFMKKIDIVINTTPIGMSPDINNMPVSEKLILNKHTVFDIIYSPDITKLIQCGINKSAGIVRGIEMLLYQGVRQFEIWTGEKAPVHIMRQAIESHSGQDD